MTVGERLRKARRRLHKTQLEIAGEVGVTQPRIQQLESGDGVPSHLIRKVSKAYGVDPLDLLHKTRAA